MRLDTTRPAARRLQTPIAAVLVVLLFATVGPLLVSSPVPPAGPAPVGPAPAPGSPYAQAGIVSLHFDGGQGGNRLVLAATGTEPMTDPTEAGTVLRQVSKITWRTHPGPIPELHLTVAAGAPPVTATALFTAADLTRSFGPRPQGLNAGQTRHTPEHLITPYSRAYSIQAMSILDSALVSTAERLPGGIVSRHETRSYCPDAAAGAGYAVTFTDGTDPESLLPAVADYWTAAGYPPDARPGLDFGRPFTSAYILVDGAVIGQVDADAQAEVLRLTALPNCAPGR